MYYIAGKKLYSTTLPKNATASLGGRAAKIIPDRTSLEAETPQGYRPGMFNGKAAPSGSGFSI